MIKPVKKTSSRKKRTKKADTPNRCTTSSTIDDRGKGTKGQRGKENSPTSGQGTMFDDRDLASGAGELSDSDGVDLTPTQQAEILAWLYRGASPAGACGQVGVSVDRFLKAVAEDEAFRHRVRSTTGVLSGNVMAVLYRTAMEGSVSAQQAFLKLFPPPVFEEPEQDVETEPVTFDELLGDLTDAELVELARAVGVDLPHQTEATLDAPRLAYLAEQISGKFAIEF